MKLRLTGLDSGVVILWSGPLGDDVPRLFLPTDTGRFRYLEVCAKLTVAGSMEADFDQNDILDVLINLEPPPSYPFSF
jgi:hypothetical protein